MANSRNMSTTELLLQVMELTSLGASSRAGISRSLRRAHPLARLDRRLDDAIEVLVGEGLIEFEADAGELVYRTTHAGLTALEQNGRYTAAATVLFTDIVGSTELIDEVGEARAHEIRQRHFALLGGTVDEFGGRVIKNLGDGLMVIFGRAQAAIECANEMQRRVAGDDDELGLRVGVHAGELLRDGNDFFGSTVIIARRLCDRAEPGQTIASFETCDSSDETFESLGSLSLKGLSTPIESVALTWTQSATSVAG